jgi:hypothetical protein
MLHLLPSCIGESPVLEEHALLLMASSGFSAGRIIRLPQI